MARMPGTTWVGEQSPRTPMTRYDALVEHTIVGYAPAHAAHFSTKADGTILQSRDTAYRSAACLDGNYRIIAIENEDTGPAFPRWTGSDVPPLTAAQVEANARILAWAHKEHGIPLQLCPDSRPASRGLAFHRQGIDGDFGPYRFGGRVSGGEVWTSSFGKVCPGDNRIAQLPAILARARVLAGNPPIAPKETDAMTPDDFAKIQAMLTESEDRGARKVADAVFGRNLYGAAKGQTFAQTVRKIAAAVTGNTEPVDPEAPARPKA